MHDTNEAAPRQGATSHDRVHGSCSREPTSLEAALEALKTRVVATPLKTLFAALSLPVPADGEVLNVPLRTVTTAPVLFQNRTAWKDGINPDHVHHLAESMKLGADMEPIEVIHGGNALVVLNGHHRLLAREKIATGPDAAVPVRFRALEPLEALAAAGADNAHTKLPMTKQERMEYAWRLVRLDHLKLARLKESEISAKAGVSARQVQVMRKRVREGADLDDSWAAVLRQSRGSSGLSDDELQAQREAEADRLFQALDQRTKFGHYALRDPDIIALALERNMPASGARVAEALIDYFPVQGPEGEDAGDF